MSNLLLEIKEEVEIAMKNNREESLSLNQNAGFEERYDEIIEKGFSANPPPKINETGAK